MFQFQAEMSFYRGKPALGSQCCKDLIYKSPTCERLTSDRREGRGGGVTGGDCQDKFSFVSTPYES